MPQVNELPCKLHAGVEIIHHADVAAQAFVDLWSGAGIWTRHLPVRGLAISRADVADFTLKAVANGKHIEKVVGISN